MLCKCLVSLQVTPGTGPIVSLVVTLCGSSGDWYHVTDYQKSHVTSITWHYCLCGWENGVGLHPGYWLSRFDGEQKGSQLHRTFHSAATGISVLVSGVNRTESEADDLPPFNDKIKNAWKYTSSSQCVIMALAFGLYLTLRRRTKLYWR
jgi:hypothetical protein